MDDICISKACGLYVSVQGLTPENSVELEDRAKRNGYSLPKEVLVEVLDTYIGTRTYNIYLDIDMPCGNHIEYATPDDIPEADVPCPCGDPTHWMLKYEELVPA